MNLNFSCYLWSLQSFVIDLQDKMTGISLYGIISEIVNERNATEAVFSMRIEDKTGEILAKLHFARSWYGHFRCLTFNFWVLWVWHLHSSSNNNIFSSHILLILWVPLSFSFFFVPSLVKVAGKGRRWTYSIYKWPDMHHEQESVS